MNNKDLEHTIQEKTEENDSIEVADLARTAVETEK